MICEKLQEIEKRLTEEKEAAETEEAIERFLKNEAYSFIISEGLVDKFLTFRRSPMDRTEKQEKVYRLTTDSNLEGLWIEG